ncbi:MAG: hypothetical protein OEY63_05580 [Gemmatimonadota bacterium]|nr:hypothetical protein [Gemmatimonadota bacterium]MDH5803648.1 hypothetical protein [Gemmatimonadota bacterium]
MIALVRDEWRVNDEWWRDPVARRYVEIISTDGARIVIYEDFIHHGWFLQYTDTSHNTLTNPS